MRLQNPAGREWIIRNAPVPVLFLILGGITVFLLLSGGVTESQQRAIVLLAIAAFVFAVALVSLGLAVRFARTLPTYVDLGTDEISAVLLRRHPPPPVEVTRTIRFERVDDVKPSRWGGGRFGPGPAPAGVFGKFDSSPDGVRLKLPETGRDLALGAGDPFDIVYLSKENYRPVLEAWQNWKKRNPARPEG